MAICCPTLTSRVRKAPVNLAQAIDARRPTCQAASIDPSLYRDMSGRLQLQVALGRVGAEIVLQRSLDVDGVGVVSFDQVAVVAVHRSDKIGKPGPHGRRQAAAERGRLGGELEREVNRIAKARAAFADLHRLHGGYVFAAIDGQHDVRFIGHVNEPQDWLITPLWFILWRQTGSGTMSGSMTG